MIEETLMTLIVTALVISPVITGIVQAIKKYVDIDGLQIIVTAILTGIILLGMVAYVFSLPLAESLLLGLLSGLGSIGAFEGIDKTKKQKYKNCERG